MPRRRDITAELKSFVTGNKNSFAKTYKEKVIQTIISRFLDARMDQVRIYHALHASKALLETVRAGEAFAFQEAVLTKERSKEIAYHSQRDHTCHTLNNFILGWYIYEQSDCLKKSFAEVFERRKLGVGKPDNIKFGTIWIYVSLLHDIGYIFEGDFSDPGAFESHKGIKAAIGCLENYFNKAFWKDNRLDAEDKKALLNEELIENFNISASSIEELSESLQSIHNLTTLLEDVDKFYAGSVRRTNNSFEIWSENYRFFSNEKMSKKIDKLRTDFKVLRTDGIKKGGPKILNHGVCSGLILLRFVTYYYLVFCGVKSLPDDKKFSKLKGRYESKEWPLTVDLWWSGLVWATAATAIHDRYQALIDTNDPDDRLSFLDDPLAFLGILVDEMQLWDRFKVFDPTKGHKFDEIPTQSSEVQLEKSAGGRKIVFSAPRHEIDVLEKSLDERLADWREVIFLDPVS
jgi:hypothetical protein